MVPGDRFGADFSTARQLFVAAASRAGASLERIAHPEHGPRGESLSTDVAWLGPRDAQNVLVMISATHGVEGFAGSGAQVDWLERGEAGRLPGGFAALLIHAINPYGFAWLRRVTQENVDLNRNWIDFRLPRPGNPGYDALNEAICPREWTAESIAASDARLREYAARNGAAALQAAISAGQYDHPRGIFYGGDSPTWSRRTQEAIFASYLRGAARVALIDFHTGLGPRGFGEQIVTDRPGSAAHRRAATWFGAAITCPFDATSTSAPIVGDGLSAAAALLAQAEVTGIALEFGTRTLEEVLFALRADAWLHAHGDPASSVGEEIRARMRAAFYGDADDWRGMILGQALLAARQAVAGLSAGRT
ncbi:MAG: M14 family metallopeptidase [Gammaproteobacteria bacterium]|nr:M14 family metallopeptidase [Gammaproteobacteria bacterium]MDE2305917.1 M14 family metallopeptidase [Gammaproteobacteria bacterium]